MRRHRSLAAAGRVGGKRQTVASASRASASNRNPTFSNTPFEALRSTSGWAITATDAVIGEGLSDHRATAALASPRPRRARRSRSGLDGAVFGRAVEAAPADQVGRLSGNEQARSTGCLALPRALPASAAARRRTWPSRARRRGRALTSARSPHDGRVQEVHAPGVSEPNMPPDLSGARLPKAPAPSDCRRPPIGRRCGEPSRVLIASPEGGRATVGSHQQRAWADEAECPSGERVEAAEAAPAPIRPPHLRPATCRRRAAQSGVRRASRADVKTGAFPFSAGAPAPRTGQDRGTRTDRAHARRDGSRRPRPWSSSSTVQQRRQSTRPGQGPPHGFRFPPGCGVLNPPLAVPLSIAQRRSAALETLGRVQRRRRRVRGRDRRVRDREELTRHGDSRIWSTSCAPWAGAGSGTGRSGTVAAWPSQSLAHGSWSALAGAGGRRSRWWTASPRFGPRWRAIFGVR